jgi:GNAT superfamily N-acetyltransferase
MTEPKIVFGWCRSQEEAVRLAKLFAGNLTPSYISHAELQGPRALTPTVWAPDIGQILEEDLLSRIDQPLDARPGERTRLIVECRMADAEAAVFLVTFNRSAPVPYAEIEDMMVAPAYRSHGIGHAFMDWISRESQARGIGRLFLESGITNEHAHGFFEDIGFHRISVVMMKALP